MTSDISKTCYREITKDNTLTGPEMKIILKDKHNLNLHPSTINKHMCSNKMIEHGCPKITVKKLRIIQDKRDDEKTKELRKAYIIKHIEEDRKGSVLFYIDESPWAIMEPKTKGRSEVG
jgi:hypothetical protein